MALELIQNADDAKADSVVFDITDRGLLVVNSGRFTYCGDLHTRPCSYIASSNYSCDYHRIADVGSGGKLSRGENIGRFGIGFVSTYQVTDHPEIRSAGVKLTLHPEEGQWFIEPFEQPEGTTFFLPSAPRPDLSPSNTEHRTVQPRPTFSPAVSQTSVNALLPAGGVATQALSAAARRRSQVMP